MKKSNVVVLVLLAIVSVLLLWLWYFLGFNRVDDPLDLVLSIVWWIVIAAAVILIVCLEKTRRRRIRTVYVGDGAAFNSERGVFPLGPAVPLRESVAEVIEGLEYDFTREDFPKPEDLEVRYFIRTEEFEAKKRDDDAQGAQGAGPGAPAKRVEPVKWKGEVVVVGSDQARPFDDPEELSRVLASIPRTA